MTRFTDKTTVSGCCPLCGAQRPPLTDLQLIDKRTFWRGIDLQLTYSEFKVFEALYENYGQFVTTERLYGKVYKPRADGGVLDDNIKVHISRIRAKLRRVGLSVAIEGATHLGYTLRIHGHDRQTA